MQQYITDRPNYNKYRYNASIEEEDRIIFAGALPALAISFKNEAEKELCGRRRLLYRAAFAIILKILLDRKE